MGHGVAYRWGGGQGQVHNAKGHAQPPRCLYAYQLAHTGDLKGGLFNQLCNIVNGVVRELGNSRAYHTGAGHTYIDYAVRLGHTVKGTSHKGVILRGVAKHHQLAGADAVALFGQLCGFLDLLAHQLYRVHIDTGFGGTDVYGGANVLRLCQRAGDGVDQLPVAGGKSLLYQGTVTADKVHPDGAGCFFQRQGVLYRVAAADACHNGNGGHADSLVNNRNTVFPLNVLAGLDQLFRLSTNFVIHLGASLVNIRIGTV